MESGEKWEFVLIARARAGLFDMFQRIQNSDVFNSWRAGADWVESNNKGHHKYRVQYHVLF